MSESKDRVVVCNVDSFLDLLDEAQEQSPGELNRQQLMRQAFREWLPLQPWWRPKVAKRNLAKHAKARATRAESNLHQDRTGVRRTKRGRQRG